MSWLAVLTALAPENVLLAGIVVLLVHRPTGLFVKCQRERTQGQNRLIARDMLAVPPAGFDALGAGEQR